MSIAETPSDKQADVAAAGHGAALLLRWLVGDLNFSIVSNNCWGAHVYRVLGLPYQTPFVGLFIPPADYVRLLQRFDDCFSSEPAFVNRSSHPRLNVWREKEGIGYPIGLIGADVELHFLHYASEAEARAKWSRRCARLARDRSRLFFKFDDREQATEADMAAFFQLPYAHKVCFAADRTRFPTVRAPREMGLDQVIDGDSLGQVSRRYFNTLRWLSTRPRWMPLPSLL